MWTTRYLSDDKHDNKLKIFILGHSHEKFKRMWNRRRRRRFRRRKKSRIIIMFPNWPAPVKIYLGEIPHQHWNERTSIFSLHSGAICCVLWIEYIHISRRAESRISWGEGEGEKTHPEYIELIDLNLYFDHHQRALPAPTVALSRKYGDMWSDSVARAARRNNREIIK